MGKKMTVDQIIAELGGAAKVMQLCRLDSSEALRHWRKYGRIPSKHWSAIHAASRKKITYEMLARMGRS